MTRPSSCIRKSKEQRNKKLTVGPKLEGSHEVRYRNTLDPAVFGQIVGDDSARPEREVVARYELFDIVSRAEGLR